MRATDDGEKVQGYVEAAGLSTYYEVEGSGEPLVLLHGGFCTIETFSGLAPSLAERFRVYLPERRGHGRTPDIDGPVTYELMARDMIAFTEAVGLPPAHWVGWSDGAIVGVLVALHRPDLVRSLVLIGITVNHDGLPPELLEMLRLDTMPPDMLPPMLRQRYAAVSADGPEHWDVVVDKLWQMMRTELTIPLTELERVAAPTLLIAGEHDTPTVEHTRAIHRALPDSRLVIVPDATHGLPMEKPDIVSALVLDFLNAKARAAG